MAATIAHHFFQAREYERALGYYVRAGDSAYRLHALKEARDHYTRGLEIAKRDGLQCDRDLGQVLKHLYLQLGRTWELELRYDDALEIYQEMQDEADRRGDQGLKLANLTALGTVFSVGASSQMDFERSKKVSEDGLALAKTLRDRQAEARILWNLMLVHHYALKDNKTAVRYGEESLAIARDLDPKEQLAFTLNDMQRVYTELGDLQRAKEVAAEAQALFRSLDNLPMLSDNLGVYALINFHGGNFEKVVEIANECIQVARIMGSDHHLLMTNFLYFIVAHERGNYGLAMQKIDGWNYFANMADHTEAKVVGITLKSWLYAELGQIEPGMELCSQAFEIAGTLSQTAREHINACLTHLHLLKNDLSRASQTFNETQFDLSKATSTDFLIYFTHTVSAMDYTLAVGEYERTIEIADASISYHEPAGIEAGLADAYYLRGKALKALGRETEAYSDLGKGAMIAEEIGSNRILWKILGAMGEIEDLRGYPVEAGQLRAKAQGIVNTIADHTGKEEWRKSFLESRKVQSIFH
jgi:tetratricopeptide (TPR) repeat protein